MKKKSIILIILAAIFLISCGSQQVKELPSSQDKKAAAQSKDKTVDTSGEKIDNLNGVVLTLDNDINMDDFLSIGFDTAILSANGVRINKAPYKTDNKALKAIKKNVSRINASGTNYVLEINSGPGFLPDGKNMTIFKNKTEAIYFAQMAKELIKRYGSDKHFQGISINIKNPDIPEDEYYSTLNFIISKIRSSYPDVGIVYNLHPLSFENGFKDVPKINFDNITINGEIYLKGISYPGYGAGYKNSIDLDRNSILSVLKNLRNLENKDNKVLITLKTPWAKNSDVLLQDIFEITRTLGYDCNICYGNSNDLYDFSKNPDIPKLIKRHSM